jgi:hypothetical protein
MPVGRLSVTDRAMLAQSLNPHNLDRMTGPDVIVESADGHTRVRECGLENPVTMLIRLNATDIELSAQPAEQSTPRDTDTSSH